MKIQPVNDMVLLRLVEAKEVTEGGIIIPENAKKAPAEGIVEAMAADSTDEVVIGDLVIFKGYTGEELDIDGVKHKLVPAGDLLAKRVSTDSIPD